jgi:hypothetical protein
MKNDFSYGDGARIIGVPVGRGTTWEERTSYDTKAVCDSDELDYRYESDGGPSECEEPAVTMD